MPRQGSRDLGFAKLSLKGRALRLLAQREHSRGELEAKLARHVQEGDDLAALLDELQAKDFLNAERAAGGHGATHKGLDVGLFSAGVVAKVALALVKIRHKQRLPVTNNPADKALAGQHRCVGRNPFTQAEGSRKVVRFAFFVRQKKDYGISVKNAANDAQNMLFNRVGGHGHMGLMVMPPTGVTALG